MKKYNKYKPSGIEWLGDIPEHWENHRIDWITSIVRGNTGLKKDELLNEGEYVALQYGKTYKVDEVNNTFNFFVNNEYYKKSQIVNQGDTILISTSESIEDLGHSCFYNRIDIGLLGGEQILLNPNRKLVDEKFLYYYSKFFRYELQKYATGLKVFRFNIDDLKHVLITLPVLDEQTAIAAYLDRKTAAIDKKKALLTKKIEYYKELRKSLINQTVTKGLNPNAKLKHSGIDWIGKIPEHWEVKRLKECLRKDITDGPHETPEFTNTGYPFISVDGIVDGELVFNNCRYISEIDYTRFSKKVKIEMNDLFMGKAASTGKIARVKVDFKFTVWSPIAVIKTKKEIDTVFIEYFLKSEAVQPQIENLCTHNTQKNIAMKDIPKIILAIPPKEEQTAIASYLDEKTTTIDQIVSNLQKQIEKLKELRKVLINDVVTGKIKVIEG